jgi:hypothetical protein
MQKINRTTGDRATDEDFRRLYHAVTELQAQVSALRSATKPLTTPTVEQTPLPPVLPNTGSTTVTPVVAAGVVGTLTSYAREDHAHQGVHSVSKVGQPQIVGDMLLQEGTGFVIGQAGNTLTLNAIFGTIPPKVVNFGGSPYAVGGGDFVIFADTTAGAVTIQFAGIAANTGRLVVVENTGATGNSVLLTCSPNSIVGISTLVNVTGKTSVWYICDGTNWYSFTNSVGN